MGSALRTIFTFAILGMIVYGLLFVAMGLPHPRWVKDLVKDTTGYEIQNTTEGPDYRYDPESGKVYQNE